MGVGVSTLHVVTTTPECSSSVSRPVGMQPVCPLGSQRAPTFLSFSAAFLLAFLSFSLAFRLASFSAWRGKQMNRVDRQRMSHSTRQRTLHAALSPASGAEGAVGLQRVGTGGKEREHYCVVRCVDGPRSAATNQWRCRIRRSTLLTAEHC